VLALAWDNLGLRKLNSAVRFLGLCQGAHPTLQLICSGLNITPIDKENVKKRCRFCRHLESLFLLGRRRIVAKRNQARGSLAKDLMSIQPPSASSAQSLR
jgi:hypothetical protein